LSVAEALPRGSFGRSYEPVRPIRLDRPRGARYTRRPLTRLSGCKKVRRFYLAWLVSLLLVLVQQGAVLHEIGHLSHGDRSTAPALCADPQDDDAICPTCQAFAQVTNPASGTAITLAQSVAAYPSIPAPVYSIVAADTLTPRSRGPPQA